MRVESSSCDDFANFLREKKVDLFLAEAGRRVGVKPWQIQQAADKSPRMESTSTTRRSTRREWPKNANEGNRAAARDGESTSGSSDCYLAFREKGGAVQQIANLSNNLLLPYDAKRPFDAGGISSDG